ncbi:MAG: hypothetical protein BYD32DRAFT_463021 [Podila humilis]|nr:MAG: hypothetical protein BYD32DRAFT_463021 [Podila humilis]
MSTVTAPPPPLNPLDLPEVRAHIGQYLDKSSAHACLLVSRDWNASFADHIWREVIVRGVATHPGNPPLSLLVRKTALVRSLRFDFICNSEHLSVDCDQLEYLALQSPALGIHDLHELSEDIHTKFQELIRRNERTLQSLKIYTPKPYLSTRFWETVLRCQNLSTLCLNCTAIEWKCSWLFWQICSRVASVEVANVRFHEAPVTDGSSPMPTTPFRRIRSLHLKHLDGMSLIQQLGVFKKCPQLTCLWWEFDHSEGRSFPAKVLCESIVTGQWPHLHSLSLSPNCMTDQDLAIVLGGLNPMTVLELPHADIGSLASVALEKHFPTLKQLHLIPGQKGVDLGALSNRVLIQCPNLKSIKTEVMSVKKLSELPDVRWACQSLHHLEMRFDFSLLAGQAEQEARYRDLLLQQLGSLTQLRTLDISRRQPHIATEEVGLRLSLSHGLHALSELGRLERLNFLGSEQRWTMNEANWIIEHWKQLKEIKGECSPFLETRSQVVHALRGHGVALYRP